jgi:hypothetical protein
MSRSRQRSMLSVVSSSSKRWSKSLALALLSGWFHHCRSTDTRRLYKLLMTLRAHLVSRASSLAR